MPLSTTELNRIANNIVASNLTLRLHSADPGASGTTARIGSLSRTLAAASWNNASNGDVTYTRDVDFGVLDAARSQTVTHYSLWRGGTFVARERLESPVTVTSGGTFKINASTIVINGSTT